MNRIHPTRLGWKGSPADMTTWSRQSKTCVRIRPGRASTSALVSAIHQRRTTSLLLDYSTLPNPGLRHLSLNTAPVSVGRCLDHASDPFEIGARMLSRSRPACPDDDRYARQPAIEQFFYIARNGSGSSSVPTHGV